ncbi:hypothetical protein ACFSUS_24305 [Spirosoma soli]|uniref:YD repeat-containing protein n=1 Tax=Spirosoma soli TaxID=1770529 RepID=A0ABW5MB05_9BACT
MRFILLSIFLTAVLLGCTPKKPEEVTPIRKCKLQSITKRGYFFSDRKFTYNELDLLTQDVETLDRKQGYVSVKTTSYTYNKGQFLIRKLIRQRGIYNTGQIDSSTVYDESYIYNDKGLLVEMEVKGQAQYKRYFEYEGNNLKEVRDESSSSISMLIFTDGKPSGLIVNDKYSSNQQKYEFNSQGYIVKVNNLDQTGVTKSSGQFSYDNTGHLIRSEEIIGGKVTRTNLFEYDDKINPELLLSQFKGIPNYELYGTSVNNRTKSTTNNSGGYFGEGSKYSYNKKGYPIQCQTLIGIPPNYPDSPPLEVTYMYSDCE